MIIEGKDPNATSFECNGDFNDVEVEYSIAATTDHTLISIYVKELGLALSFITAPLEVVTK